LFFDGFRFLDQFLDVEGGDGQQLVDASDDFRRRSGVGVAWIGLGHDAHDVDAAAVGFTVDGGVHPSKHATLDHRQAKGLNGVPHGFVGGKAEQVHLLLVVIVLDGGLVAVHADGLHAGFREGVHGQAAPNFGLFGPVEQGPDELVPNEVVDHQLARQKDDLVASIDGTDRTSAVGAHGRECPTVVDDRHRRQTGVKDTPNVVQFQVLNEVRSDDRTDHAHRGETRDHQRILGFDVASDATLWASGHTPACRPMGLNPSGVMGEAS